MLCRRNGSPETSGLEQHKVLNDGSGDRPERVVAAMDVFAGLELVGQHGKTRLERGAVNKVGLYQRLECAVADLPV